MVNIYPEQAEALCKRFGDPFIPVLFSGEALAASCRDADYFINASVMGQVGFDDFSSFAFLDRLKKDAIVYDVNYSNPDAKLPPAARATGRKAYVGRSMTACQGIRAMEIWTGRAPSDQAAVRLIQELMNI